VCTLADECGFDAGLPRCGDDQVMRRPTDVEADAFPRGEAVELYQLGAAESDLFLDGEQDVERGVRYVLVPDDRLDYSSKQERTLAPN